MALDNFTGSPYNREQGSRRALRWLLRLVDCDVACMCQRLPYKKMTKPLKTLMIGVKVSADESEILERAADRAGVKVSTYVRNCALRQAKRVPKGKE